MTQGTRGVVSWYITVSKCFHASYDERDRAIVHVHLNADNIPCAEVLSDTPALFLQKIYPSTLVEGQSTASRCSN